LQTNIQELLITALLEGLILLSDENKSVRIHLEGHGRDSWDDDLDVSRTVGWFTALYPILFQLDRLDPTNRLKAVKRTLRSLSTSGITYSASKEKEFELGPRITFNYLGRFQGLEGDSFFQEMQDIQTFDQPSTDAPDTMELLITGYHLDDHLVVDFSFPQGLDSLPVHDWASYTVYTLEKLVELLCNSDFQPSFSIDDCVLVPTHWNRDVIVQAIRERLNGRNDLSIVEDVFPITPLQVGILSAMMKDKSQYIVQIAWKLNGNVDLDRLRKAWKDIVMTHSILRTVFLSLPDGLLQVVLKEDYSSWKKLSEWDVGNFQHQLETLFAQDRALGYEITDLSYCRLYLAEFDSKSY
jgi:hypothetical protein